MSVACPNCQTYPCSNPGCLEPLQAEIARLEAINAELKEQQKTDYDKREALDDELARLIPTNAELLAACEQTLEIVRYLDGKAVDILEAAIANAQPQGE